ncbi:MAG: hypothetical protein HY866_07510 [Chloroflexi bacterium]|nr:hypothetical protein [Chloroflexota bacterium]
MSLLFVLLLARSILPVEAGRAQPDFERLIGSPGRLSAYWHDQRWTAGDEYACALYAQAAVLEALGYNFERELADMRALGQRDGWYSPQSGTIGLGQPLRAKDVPFEVFGSPIVPPISPARALARLQRALLAGRYPLVNLDAQRLSYYHGSAIRWHTLWVTGMRLDAAGHVITIIASDSYRGAAVEYPVDEFMAAWGSVEFNYYAIFVEDSRRAEKRLVEIDPVRISPAL